MKKNTIFALIMAFLFVMTTMAFVNNGYYNDESIEMIDIEIDYSSQKY